MTDEPQHQAGYFDNELLGEFRLIRVALERIAAAVEKLVEPKSVGPKPPKPQPTRARTTPARHSVHYGEPPVGKPMKLTKGLERE